VDAVVSAASGRDAHAHGSLPEEAARLAEALSAWVNTSGVTTAARRAAGAAAEAAAATTGEEQTPTEHAPYGDGSECSVCPVCQLLRLVRGLRPEVYEHLTVASTALLAAARAALEPGPQSGSGPEADGLHEPAPEAPARPRSQRIDIR
jgi:hypothetical protein